MAKISVVMADSDALYLTRMADHISAQFEDISLKYFTETAPLAQYLSSSQNTCDILMVSPDFAPLAERAPATLRCLLTDHEGEEGSWQAVNKYQRAKTMMTACLAQFAERTGRSDFGGRGKTGSLRVIGSYSPVGGSGKTTAALLTGAWMAQNQRRVLYIDLSGTGGYCAYLGNTPRGGLSQVMATIQSGRSNAFELQNHLHIDGATKLQYLPTLTSSYQVGEITAQDVGKLLGDIEKTALFDDVILDFDSPFSQEKNAMLDHCHAILFPCPTGVVAGETLNQFLQLHTLHNCSLLPRLVVIQNPMGVDPVALPPQLATNATLSYQMTLRMGNLPSAVATLQPALNAICNAINQK